jgi:acetylornithine deacetylase/succinyl-diaminopimelate desuccinylase-like protein
LGALVTEIQTILDHLDAGLPAARDRLFALLRIASVSAQPAHAADCQDAAGFLKADLESLGFSAEIHQTAGQPILLASHRGPSSGGPHLLFYGHYDVQPADPLNLWTSPPFEPVLVDGPHGPRITARGAVDDKGQVMMWIEAFRAWHVVHGAMPACITVLIEGEEEVGSPNLEAFLIAHKAALQADIAVISDTGMWDIDTPAITTRLRGLVYLQINLHAARRDLHSGLFGGSALNPLNLLTKILGDLHDADGRVTIPGFYDGILPLAPEQAAQWEAMAFDEKASLADIGLSVPVGEKGLPALQRTWARPTADINGIWGGYMGEGSKTVIPADAHAKLSFRLVPDQDPAAVFAAFEAFVAARLPADARVEIINLGASPGIEVPAENRFIHAARAALSEEYGRDALLIGSGGSIPVVESLHRLLGVESLLMGFGLADDQVHSPNEKFELRCFHQGMRAHARLLGKVKEALLF